MQKIEELWNCKQHRTPSPNIRAKKRGRLGASVPPVFLSITAVMFRGPSGMNTTMERVDELGEAAQAVQADEDKIAGGTMDSVWIAKCDG